MDELTVKRLTPPAAPVTTGTPGAVRTISQPPAGASFQEILRQRMAESSLSFSKHAVNRVVERNIQLNQTSMDRLHQGVRLAEEKGLQEPLILVGNTAFIVSVKNNTVITTVEPDELQGSVFTNIDGTVII